MLLFFGLLGTRLWALCELGVLRSVLCDTASLCVLQPSFPLHRQPGCTKWGSSKDLSTEQVGHRGSAVEPTWQLRILLCSFGKFASWKAVAHHLPWSFMGWLVQPWKAVWSWHRHAPASCIARSRPNSDLLPGRYLAWWFSVIGWVSVESRFACLSFIKHLAK